MLGFKEKKSLLHEFKDYFARENKDMPRLSRKLVEHRFSICEGKKTSEVSTKNYKVC